MYRCPSCHHRFCPVDDQSMVLVEQLYGDSYTGFTTDPIFVKALDRILERDFQMVVPAGARILDVGCGNGDFIALAKERGYSVQGVDVSASSVRLCRKRNLDVVQGTLSDLPLEQKFDILTMWDVVEHVPDPFVLLHRAWNLLRPGGHLVIKTPLVSDSTFRIVSAVPPLAGRVLQTPKHVQFFTKRSLNRLAHETTFEAVTIETLGAMRQRVVAGTIRKRVGRLVVHGIDALCRNGNLYAWLRRAS